jgi:hypothetical protein
VQMTVQTVKATASNAPGPLARGRVPVVMAGLLLPLLGLRRKLRNTVESRLMLLVLLIGGALGANAITGCGFSRNLQPMNSMQSYTLIVTSTSSTVQHSQSTTLNMQ